MTWLTIQSNRLYMPRIEPRGCSRAHTQFLAEITRQSKTTLRANQERLKGLISSLAAISHQTLCHLLECSRHKWPNQSIQGSGIPSYSHRGPTLDAWHHLH